MEFCNSNRAIEHLLDELDPDDVQEYFDFFTEDQVDEREKEQYEKGWEAGHEAGYEEGFDAGRGDTAEEEKEV